MPTYEYICPDCGVEYEVFQRMSDAPLNECNHCAGSALRRKIGRGAGFIFKGGGFYETDFKDRKGTPETAPKEAAPAAASPAAPCSSTCACAPAAN